MKAKIEIHSSIKYFIIFITAALLVWLIIILFFLHKNFYLIIQETDSIYQLQREISSENLDIKLFNEVRQKIEQRANKKAPYFGVTENPFI